MEGGRARSRKLMGKGCFPVLYLGSLSYEGPSFSVVRRKRLLRFPSSRSQALGVVCVLPQPPRQPCSSPTERDAWSCAVLAYRITGRDYRGEALHAETVGALQSAFVLPGLAA